jgi:hypothetical protein
MRRRLRRFAAAGQARAAWVPDDRLLQPAGLYEHDAHRAAAHLITKDDGKIRVAAEIARVLKSENENDRSVVSRSTG